MMTKAITLHLPETLYDRYKYRADQARRSLEDELIEAVAEAAPEEELPPALAEEITRLGSLSDKALWKAVRSKMPLAQLKRLNQLNRKQQQHGMDSLSDEERQTQNELGDQYDRYILIRAEAVVLLKRRGYDISSLGPNSTSLILVKALN